MNVFLLNLLLAIGWMAITATFSLGNFLFGFLIALAALALTRPLYGETAYFRRLIAWPKLLGIFLYELVVSSFKVAWDIVTPPMFAKPGIVAMPLDAQTDLEIMMTANIISLTPGTLSLDVSADRSTLYVHCMFLEDPEAEVRAMKETLEKAVLEALR